MSVEKMVPEIRFEGFSDEWQSLSLDKITDVYDGTHQTPAYTKNGVMFLSAENIRSLTSQKFISEKAFKEEFKVYPQKNDVLMTRIGDVGTANVVETDDDKAYYVTLALLKYKQLSPYFLKSSIASPYVQKDIWLRTLHIAFPKKINMNEIKQVNVNCPTNSKESDKIGNYFQKLDNLINQYQQKHDKLSNIKKAMLEKMFPKQGETIPEIRFKGFSGEWDEKELGTDVADIVGGGTPSTSISEFWNGDIDWYSPTEIGSNVYAEGSQKKITALGLNSSSAKILPAGNTVLFTSRAGIGDMAILTKPGTTNQGFQSFVVKEGFVPYFIYSAGKQIKEYALKHASGSTFLEISGKQLGRMKILVPCETEQTAIGNYFQKLDALIKQHQQQITKLNNIKQACLSKMFV
ncbi:restriction endonuclease subunit S [Shewanella xiamenensis]|uniref:Restriction endonuclease subunit S n=1 Tax=Shewanella xiamenensis TaxID=332186 RepID=A0AAE4Q378_9GAMM|nr:MULTISPECIES: restriction endonuclease subunit S [Shewanella]ABK50380.1 restriction modification system DNA specificity domain [Shewanella sp. ANA-3]MBW0278498.1 restriction endonuclease subunit S [Shewanella xiamenensis]MDV5392998.1 restriction endonuclease subunit S [Shewanella xiamenensis]